VNPVPIGNKAAWRDGQKRRLNSQELPAEELLTMKKTIFALALCAAFATPSFAQSVGEKTGVNSVLGIAPKTEDFNFIKEVAMSDMTEIEIAKIAQQKGNAEEKKFAETMIADHTKTSTELKSMVPSNLKAALPTALDDASQKKVAKLRDTRPEDFASEYDPMQVNAHKDAVSLSSAMPMAARTQNSMSGPVRRFRH
jgi:putative membrane protein